MRRRSKTGPDRAKSPRRKIKTQKRRGEPKTTCQRNSSAADRKTQSDVAQLARERDEALEREKATAEVLRVVSSSSGDLESVFQTLLLNATRICGAGFGVLALFDGRDLRHAASHNLPPSFVEEMRPQTVV